MGQMNGVNIAKLQGGLGRTGENTDSVFALFSYSITNVIPGGEFYKLTSVFDAEELGIDTAYDDNNFRRLYRQIQDFFRLAPNGTLYIGSIDEFSAENPTTIIKSCLERTPEVKGYGYITFTNFDNNTINAHQSMINALKAKNQLIDFGILAYAYSIPNVNPFSLNSPNISILIAAEGNQDGVYEPALGSFLGMLAVRQVSENVGSVDILNKPLAKRGLPDYSLTDSVEGRWISAGLTDGRLLEELTSSQFNALKNAGFIMAAQYQGYPGFFFTGSETCMDRASDFGFIENNRVFNKAARIVRNTLLPRVKGKVKKDPTTGFIAATTTSYWESLLNRALERMIADNDISGFQVSIDNKQVVNDTNPVKIKLLVVLDDIAHEFEVAIGLTNSI